LQGAAAQIGERLVRFGKWIGDRCRRDTGFRRNRKEFLRILPG